MFVSGILIVRNLPVSQYAYYTLATSAVGVAAALSDSGMAGAVFAQGGRVWLQRDRLGAVLSAGLAIRRKITVRCALLLSPVLVWMLLRQGASVLEALVLCAGSAPVFFATSATALLEIPQRLHQRLKFLQLLQIGSGALRLACVALVALVLPVAWLVLLSSAIAPMFQNRKLRTGSTDIADFDAAQDNEASQKIRQQIVRSFPGALYYVFGGQLTILLISLFGTTENVAQVGALGRIAMIVMLLLAVFFLVASPRYARIPETETRKLLRVYLLLLGAVGAACAAGLLFTWAFPDVVLFVLGSKYSALTGEVVLAVAAGALQVLASASSSMAAVRGTVVSPLLTIPPSIAAQALLVYLLPLDSVSSMFWLSIAFNGVQFIVSSAVFLRRLIRDARLPGLTARS